MTIRMVFQQSQEQSNARVGRSSYVSQTQRFTLMQRLMIDIPGEPEQADGQDHAAQHG